MSANRIREEVGEEANTIFGATIDEELGGRIRVSIVATGIDMPTVAEAAKPVRSGLAPATGSSGGLTPSATIRR